MYLTEISPDPDDADIESGRTQFVSDNIPANRIVNITTLNY